MSDTKDIEFAPGVVSMMRRMVPKAVRTGQGMIIAGVGLSVGMLWTVHYELLPVAISLVAGGPSLIGAALGFKAWQAHAEAKET